VGDAISEKRKRGEKNKGAAQHVDDDTCVDVDNNQRKVPALVMWYLLVIDHLKRLFSNSKNIKLMTWHTDRPDRDDWKLQHPSGARQWKTFDANHEEFCNETRNIRFVLSIDGMNPFGERSSTHSTWPVILTIYNLPPWPCHKRKYLLLTILIQGPKQPCINIDVFLEPLLIDMKNLWEDGFRMWDEYRQEYLTLRAIIFVTINDYPALFSMNGQIKGKIGCVVCIDSTAFLFLPGSKKTVYMRHRRFLLKSHRYRKMKDHFDNTIEKDGAPQYLSGKKVFEMVQKVRIKLGKKSLKKDPNKKRNTPFIVEGVPFKKTHFFQVFGVLAGTSSSACHRWYMNLVKNFFESTIGFLDLSSKKKDSLKSRIDLVELGIRLELHP
jgi:hypothetical protein